MEASEETNGESVEETKNTTDESKVEEVEPETAKKTSNNVSEYDSAEEYSEEEVEHNPQSKESDDDSSDRSVVLEREDGDGQESVPTRKIDDDEDKKNPQYIPKRGTFYEHDDRTMEDDEIKAEEKEKADKEGKKKIWTDKKENWSHDKFNDSDQAPKSRSELIAIYGYDIRNEEGPPRARRRRRYGRGPNKYTRNWEDEDAYSKPPIVITKKVGKKFNRKSSPSSDKMEQQNNKNRDVGNSSGQSSISYEEQANSIEPNVSNQPNQYSNERVIKNNSFNVDSRQNNKNQRPGTGRVSKPTREIKDSDIRGITKPRQYSVKPQGSHDKEQIPSQNYTNKKMHDITSSMGKMNVQDQQGSSKAKHGNNRQTTVPPRLQGENKGSKRYSSIRQRSLPESVTPPFTQPQQHNYYNVDSYQSPQVTSGQVQPQSQQIIHQPTQILPNPPQIAPIPQQPLATIAQQVPVTASLPPQFATPFPQAPPAFLQPAPPQFIPQQTTPILNYVPGVPGQPSFAPQQPTFQGYQQPFNPVNQTTEMQFQPLGGITYYSPQEQQAAQRAALQKRPKAAIPIVPPPPEHKGRGRIANQEILLQPGDCIDSVDVDNQNEVEPNYEDVVA